MDGSEGSPGARASMPMTPLLLQKGFIEVPALAGNCALPSAKTKLTGGGGAAGFGAGGLGAAGFGAGGAGTRATTGTGAGGKGFASAATILRG